MEDEKYLERREKNGDLIHLSTMEGGEGKQGKHFCSTLHSYTQFHFQPSKLCVNYYRFVRLDQVFPSFFAIILCTNLSYFRIYYDDVLLS